MYSEYIHDILSMTAWGLDLFYRPAWAMSKYRICKKNVFFKFIAKKHSLGQLGLRALKNGLGCLLNAIYRLFQRYSLFDTKQQSMQAISLQYFARISKSNHIVLLSINLTNIYKTLVLVERRLINAHFSISVIAS